MIWKKISMNQNKLFFDFLWYKHSTMTLLNKNCSYLKSHFVWLQIWGRANECAEGSMGIARCLMPQRSWFLGNSFSTFFGGAKIFSTKCICMLKFGTNCSSYVVMWSYYDFYGHINMFLAYCREILFARSFCSCLGLAQFGISTCFPNYSSGGFEHCPTFDEVPQSGATCGNCCERFCFHWPFLCPGFPEMHKNGLAHWQLFYGRANGLQFTVGLPGGHCDRTHQVSWDESVEIRKLQSFRTGYRAVFWKPSQPELHSAAQLQGILAGWRQRRTEGRSGTWETEACRTWGASTHRWAAACQTNRFSFFFGNHVVVIESCVGHLVDIFYF